MASLPPVKRLPLCTLGLAALALIVFLLPASSALLVFDRAGIANGELWRLLSAHLVHFSIGHLVANISVLIVAGTLIELRSRRLACALYAVSALLIGAGLFLIETDLGIFAGASGIACAAVALLALQGLHDRGGWRVFCAMLLSGMILKIVLEIVFGISAVNAPEAGFVAVPQSHALGVLAAFAVHIIATALRGVGSIASDAAPC